MTGAWGRVVATGTHGGRRNRVSEPARALSSLWVFRLALILPARLL